MGPRGGALAEPSKRELQDLASSWPCGASTGAELAAGEVPLCPPPLSSDLLPAPGTQAWGTAGVQQPWHGTGQGSSCQGSPGGQGGTCLQVDDGEGSVCPLDDGDQVLGGGREECPESAIELSLLGLPVALQVCPADPTRVAGEGHVEGCQAELGRQGSSEAWAWAAVEVSASSFPGGCEPLAAPNGQGKVPWAPLPRAGHYLPMGSVGQRWLAGAGAAFVLPSAPGIMWPGSAVDTHPCAMSATDAAPTPSQPQSLCLPGWCCPATIPSPQHVPPGMAKATAKLTSEFARASSGCAMSGPLVCALFASWMESRRQSCGVCAPPQAKVSVPLLGHEWTHWVPRPSPGTVGWRLRGRHQPGATLSPPPAQGKEQRTG